jgi:hypothetical protein
VPLDLLGLLKGKDVLLWVIDVASERFSAIPSLSARRRISAHTSSGVDAAFVPRQHQW